VGLDTLVRFGEAVRISQLGNRVSALTNAVLAGSVYLAFSDTQNELLPLLAMTGILGNVLVQPINQCGRKTVHHYRRTLEHIRRNGGRLGLRYVKKIIEKSENEPYIGYCQQQGLFLAAKKTGNVLVFRKLQKRYSNVVLPFF